MSADSDSKSDAGSRTTFGRLTSLLTTRGKPVEDKVEVEFLKQAFFDQRNVFISAGSKTLRAMPKPLRRAYARMLNMQNLAIKDLKTKTPWKERIAKGENVDEEIWIAAHNRNVAAFGKFMDKVAKDGAEKAANLGKEWEEWVNSHDSDPVTESFAAGSKAAKEQAEEEFVNTGGSFPAVGARAVDWNKIDSADLHVLILGLADGLEYDRFDTKRIRAIVFGSKTPPTLNEFVTVCAAYIFIGNNSTRLSNKVKNQQVGQATLGVLNKFGIVRSKINSTTLTLARWAIAFSPAVWALRNIYETAGRLAGAGVVTSTPVVLQDVALSGVSDKINNGAQIENFLLMFNRALFQFKESKATTKTPESTMDETAKKFHGISLAGAKADPVLQSWDYNTKKDEMAIREFYDLCFDSIMPEVEL